MSIKLFYLGKLKKTKREEFTSLVNSIISSNDINKVVQMNLDNAEIDLSDAINLITFIHSTPVDLYTKSSGTLSPGATLIAAAGKPSERKADFSTYFQLTKDGKKLGKASINQYGNFLIILNTLTGGKAGRIRNKMKLDGVVSASEAMSLGLVDDVSKISNKYADLLKVKKEEAKAAKKKSKEKGSETSIVNEVDEQLSESIDKQVEAINVADAEVSA